MEYGIRYADPATGLLALLSLAAFYGMIVVITYGIYRLRNQSKEE